MRVPMVSAALLLVFITLIAKTSGEDLYLEGEDDSANEFLEVNDDSGFGASLHRLKRHLTTSVNRLIRAVTSTTPQYDYNTEDPDVGEDDDPDDFDIDSGTISSLDLEPKEKTVRVTFVVMEPYQLNYSNRDSPEFQNISLSLAAAVDDLFRDLPGTQRTSLVRIQSRPTDEFSCKVTLDISSIGFENTKALTSLLRDQIRTTGKLGPVTVSDADFSENINDAGYNSPLYTCATDEIQCNSNKICLPASMRCDKNRDCEDGTDELDCPPDYTEDIEQEVESPATAPPCVPWTCPLSYYTICESQKCDGNSDCPDNEDENDCPEIETTPDYVETKPEPENTTPLPSQQSPYFTTTPGAPQGPLCEANDWKCDETRCVPESSRCDGRRDCNDGTDEADCPIYYLAQSGVTEATAPVEALRQSTSVRSRGVPAEPERPCMPPPVQRQPPPPSPAKKLRREVEEYAATEGASLMAPANPPTRRRLSTSNLRRWVQHRFEREATLAAEPTAEAPLFHQALSTTRPSVLSAAPATPQLPISPPPTALVTAEAVNFQLVLQRVQDRRNRRREEPEAGTACSGADRYPNTMSAPELSRPLRALVQTYI